MQTQPLGHTGIQVSSLCLGAMFFGTRTDHTTSFQILDQYVEAGGSFIDTANNYAFWVEGGHGGESETLLGKWMRERGNRSKLFIASKVGFNSEGIEMGLSPRQIEEECHKSLKRLGVETLDLYYAHVDDRFTPLEDTLQTFDRLVKAGKVRFIGASNYLAWRLEQARWVSEANNWVQFCCIQQRHTYLRLRPGMKFGRQVSANEDLLDYCKNRNITLLAYSVLLGGAYTRADRSIPTQHSDPDNQQRLTVLRAIAQETGATANQVVLAWLRQASPPIIPLIAASSSAQLQENLDALKVQLTSEQMERLNQAG